MTTTTIDSEARTEPMAPTQLITIVVPEKVRDALIDPTSPYARGQGGFQRLARKLADKLEHTKVLTLTPDEFRQIVHYAHAYGIGGFQAKLQAIVVEWVHQNFDVLMKGE